MPLIYQQHIRDGAKLGVWQISEPEEFFTSRLEIPVSIKHPHKRLQHLAGRYLLAELFPSFSLNQIKINEDGKPVALEGNLHFSISHCGEYAAVIGGSAAPVGIDIEVPAKKITSVAHKFLTPEEQALLAVLPLSKEAQYTLAWSIKEAMFKLNGRRQVDFKQHLKIESVAAYGEGWITGATLCKNGATRLQLESLVINHNFLTFVLLS